MQPIIKQHPICGRHIGNKGVNVSGDFAIALPPSAGYIISMPTATAEPARHTGKLPSSRIAREMRAECNSHDEKYRRACYRRGLEFIKQAGHGHAITGQR
ncbi:MAG: hypothetical protein LBK76_10410 [Verrucomicrobiales bacterium]|jgi:hypothetical protein|nr:hypothetical protein [Verrucomicrobiales bacterium]